MQITNGSLVTMKSGKAVGTVIEIVHMDDLLTEVMKRKVDYSVTH